MEKYLIIYTTDDDEETKVVVEGAKEDVIGKVQELYDEGGESFSIYKLISDDVKFAPKISGLTNDDDDAGDGDDKEGDDDDAGDGDDKEDAEDSTGRVKRSPENLAKMRTRILSYIGAHPGCGAADIADALDVTTKELVLPMRQLLGEKKLRKTGKARGVKYTVRD